MKHDKNYKLQPSVLSFLFSISAFFLFSILVIFSITVAKKMPEDDVLVIWITLNFIMLIMGFLCIIMGALTLIIEKKNIIKSESKWFSIISIILGFIIVIFQLTLFGILIWLLYGYRHGL